MLKEESIGKVILNKGIRLSLLPMIFMYTGGLMWVYILYTDNPSSDSAVDLKTYFERQCELNPL